MKKIAFALVCSIIILSAPVSFAETSGKMIIQDLEEIQTRLNDLSSRQQKLLQDLESLKIIARRH